MIASVTNHRAQHAAKVPASIAARELGAGWSVELPTDADGAALPLAYLVAGPEAGAAAGARLSVRVDWRNAERLEVTGTYPDGTYREVYPAPKEAKATVAIGRAERALAGAIRSRVLPTYLPELARVSATLDAKRAAEDARRSGAEKLAGMAPELARATDRHGRTEGARHGAGEIDTVSISSNGPSRVGWGRFTVTGDSVAVDLHSVPPAVAAQLLRVLAAANAAELDA